MERRQSSDGYELRSNGTDGHSGAKARRGTVSQGQSLASHAMAWRRQATELLNMAKARHGVEQMSNAEARRRVAMQRHREAGQRQSEGYD